MRKKRMSWLVLSVVFLFLSGLTATVADDWPQWRGAERDGMSSETNLLQTWPENGPPLVWKVSGLGAGFSSLAVVNGRIFTMGDLGDSQYVIALDGNGQRLWKRRIGPAWKHRYPGPRATPTVDGDVLYAIGTEGDLVCLHTVNGQVQWQKSLVTDFDGQMMSRWKFSESPLIDDHRLIVTPGGKETALVALDKTNGREIWRSTIPELGPNGKDGAGYSSVVVSEGGGIRQYVQLMGRGAIGVEAATGKFLWGYNRVANTTANVTTPIIDGDYVFVSTGYGTGSALLRLARTGAGVEAEEVYFLEAKTLQNHHGGLILLEDHVYGGTGHNRGFPICLEMKSGKVKWGPVRNAGKNSAAVSYGDGHLYFRYQNGLMLLLEVTPNGYREKGSFLIPEVNHPSWSHPVISGGRLYLREQDDLMVYDIRESHSS